jgi:hypothetical protein
MSTFTIACGDRSRLFHDMAHVPPSSPEYESVHWISVDTFSSVVEYTYRQEAFPQLLFLFPFLCRIRNHAYYEETTAYFHMTNPDRQVFDLLLRLDFVKVHDYESQCTLTVEHFELLDTFRFTPPMVRNKILHHIVQQVKNDFESVFPTSS